MANENGTLNFVRMHGEWLRMAVGVAVGVLGGLSIARLDMAKAIAALQTQAASNAAAIAQINRNLIPLNQMAHPSDASVSQAQHKETLERMTDLRNTLTSEMDLMNTTLLGHEQDTHMAIARINERINRIDLQMAQHWGPMPEGK